VSYALIGLESSVIATVVKVHKWIATDLLGEERQAKPKMVPQPSNPSLESAALRLGWERGTRALLD